MIRFRIIPVIIIIFVGLSLPTQSSIALKKIFLPWRNFEEPFPVKHKKFADNKEYSLNCIDEEIERYRKLTQKENLSDEEVRKWFLFDKAPEDTNPNTKRALRNYIEDNKK